MNLNSIFQYIGQTDLKCKKRWIKNSGHFPYYLASWLAHLRIIDQFQVGPQQQHNHPNLPVVKYHDEELVVLQDHHLTQCKSSA
jgi:hypothetical protein